MIKKIVADKEALSIPAQPATAEDAAIAQDLLDTIEDMGTDCACLAANQIGEPKAVLVYRDDNDEPHVIYNPVIKKGSKAFRTKEACFSVDKESQVIRYADLQLTYDTLVDGELVTRNGRFRGWTAQIIQHCIDHFKGRVI